MKRITGRRAWLIGGGLFAVAFIGWGAFALTNVLAHARHTEVNRFDAAGVQRLRVSLESGKITIRAADVDTITVTALVSSGIGKTRLHQVRRGDMLDLSIGCPWYSTWCSVNYSVVVPATVELDLSADNGRVLVQGTEAPVKVRANNGHVELIDLSGTIEVDSDNGYVDGRRLRSTDVDASSGNGHVKLEFSVPVHRVKAYSDNGYVEVHVPDVPGAYQVTAATDNGSRKVGVRTDPSGTDSINASSDNGHVEVGYLTP